MRNNLIVNYYRDKVVERTNELDFCILENIKNELIDNIVVIANQSDMNHLDSICPSESKQKMIPIITGDRPSFNDYFRITSIFSDENNINIISNLDIIIPAESLIAIPYYMTTEKTCLALSRWDINNGAAYKNNSTLFDRWDSQDTWVFKGGVPIIADADIQLGKAGCDNKIAYLLEQSGYNVINPSKTIKTYHLHLTNIRNYTDVVGQAIERIPPPYKLIIPTA